MFARLPSSDQSNQNQVNHLICLSLKIKSVQIQERVNGTPHKFKFTNISVKMKKKGQFWTKSSSSVHTPFPTIMGCGDPRFLEFERVDLALGWS